MNEDIVINSFPACGILSSSREDYNRHLFNIIVNKNLPGRDEVDIATENDIVDDTNIFWDTNWNDFIFKIFLLKLFETIIKLENIFCSKVEAKSNGKHEDKDMRTMKFPRIIRFVNSYDIFFNIK